ncbi:CMRF35-like molecule 9 [Xyrauchen texanus]|uniref:CMRF35-like molecule 9 n=1 Tax=Xyrauchen texanus TaxID=154827 RepID=UPI0022423C8B|nr:CMRF35-like molecule 9 [Xyrauchen texanus]
MWKVFGLSVFTVWLLDLGCAVKHTEIIGYEGEDLLLNVKYRSGYEENNKYFSRSSGFFEEKLVQTAQPNSWTQHGQFALFDNTTSRLVTIIIYRLGAADSGLYYCGVDVTLDVDPLVEIQIMVKKGEPRRPSSEPRVVINGDDVIANPADITAQNWAKKRDQDRQQIIGAV